MDKLFDIFLPVGPKDYYKLPYVVDSIQKFIPERKDIIICSPDSIPEEITENINGNFLEVIDKDVLPCDRTLWTYRPNWCFQQHLKLFQKITSDWYVTLDCDNIINRKISFFEEDSPIWWTGWEQHHDPYFLFNELIVNLKPVANHTFVADMNLFYRPIIQDMLDRHGYTIESFIEKSQKITNPKCYMAEPELYGNYVEKYSKGLYIIKQLKQAINARWVKINPEDVWRHEEIERIIKENKDKDIDIISIHTWDKENS